MINIILYLQFTGIFISDSNSPVFQQVILQLIAYLGDIPLVAIYLDFTTAIAMPKLHVQPKLHSAANSRASNSVPIQFQALLSTPEEQSNDIMVRISNKFQTGEAQQYLQSLVKQTNYSSLSLMEVSTTLINGEPSTPPTGLSVHPNSSSDKNPLESWLVAVIVLAVLSAVAIFVLVWYRMMFFGKKPIEFEEIDFNTNDAVIQQSAPVPWQWWARSSSHGGASYHGGSPYIASSDKAGNGSVGEEGLSAHAPDRLGEAKC
jgi:hypothetical protein